MQKTNIQKSQALFIDGKDRTDEIESYAFEGNKCLVTYKNNGKTYAYHQDKIKIVQSALQSAEAASVFSYLKQIAEAVGLKTEEGNNILADHYDKISFIPEHSVLSHYLNGKQPEKDQRGSPIGLFPFGFNLSQKKGVDEAFSHPLSIIEGPPGTGKTQTILNMIANAVMNHQSVAVVSSNNAATKNVFDKLDRNGLSFIAALLGNSEKKKEFLESQAEIPDLSGWQLTAEEAHALQESNTLLFAQLSEKLEQQNELALMKRHLENVETEYRHFTSAMAVPADLRFKKDVSSGQLLSLWITIEAYEASGRKFNWWRKLTFPFRYGVRDKTFYERSYRELIRSVQAAYYTVKISELTLRKAQLESALEDFSFGEKMKTCTEVSMRLFRHALHQRYQEKKRTQYTAGDLHLKSEEFIRDYPVILSTAYSLRRSLDKKVVYDFVIIDECSQVDLATGVLALSCAKKVVIVGDLKQLPNVVNQDTARKTDLIFQAYQLPEAYRYSSHSLLSSVAGLFPGIPKTLLREHYRCHPQIIDFCNRKFYHNQLIILSEAQTGREPLLVYRTVAGNHARDRMNRRQIDVIVEEIIPQQQLETADLGIVTPYRNQTSALQQAFQGTSVKADTVDQFQGRENEVIILSTVDNEISGFTDHPNRLNVAVSRARDQLIVVVNGNENEKDNNISDLIRYIEYQNFTVVDSQLHSIFDYLYKGYEAKKRELLSGQKQKSVFDSENLMHLLILEVLSQDEFSKYDAVLHFPLRNLLSDFSKLSAEEEQYAGHHATHLDFVIYNKLGKNPVLAVEVDGYEYHREGSRQNERDAMKNKILETYGLPLLRFSTTGSGEKEKLVSKLNEIGKNNFCYDYGFP